MKGRWVWLWETVYGRGPFLYTATSPTQRKDDPTSTVTKLPLPGGNQLLVCYVGGDSRNNGVCQILKQKRMGFPSTLWRAHLDAWWWSKWRHLIQEGYWSWAFLSFRFGLWANTHTKRLRKRKTHCQKPIPLQSPQKDKRKN